MIAELYDRYGTRAWRVALAMCGDAEHAERAVVDGFQSTWDLRTEPDAVPANLAPRLLGSVCRSAAGSPRPDGVVAWQARLARLPDRQRAVIVLAYYGELSDVEIAAELDLSDAAVKTEMHRGLGQLRHELGALIR